MKCPDIDMKYKKKKKRQAKEEKKAKKSLFPKDKGKVYMGIFIAVIMTTSLFGIVFYGFGGAETSQVYKGQKFTLTTEGYQTKVDGTTYTFSLIPQDVEEALVGDDVIDRLHSTQTLVTTSDPNSTFNQDIAIAAFMFNQIYSEDGKTVVNAFTKNITALPTVECSQATPEVPVIEFVETINTTQARLQDNCIIIEFDSIFGLQQITHNIFFQKLGIM